MERIYIKICNRSDIPIRYKEIRKKNVCMIIQENIHIHIVLFIETIFWPLQTKAETQMKRAMNK